MGRVYLTIGVFFSPTQVELHAEWNPVHEVTFTSTTVNLEKPGVTTEVSLTAIRALTPAKTAKSAKAIMI